MLYCVNYTNFVTVTTHLSKKSLAYVGIDADVYKKNK